MHIGAVFYPFVSTKKSLKPFVVACLSIVFNNAVLQYLYKVL
jgi:hypothetical protein